MYRRMATVLYRLMPLVAIYRFIKTIMQLAIVHYETEDFTTAISSLAQWAEAWNAEAVEVFQ